MYFPSASIAYAYEPSGLKNGEELSPKFKSHNWFLAPVGIAARILVWLRYGGNNNIFNGANQLGKSNLTFTRGFQTSTISSKTASTQNAVGVWYNLRYTYYCFNSSNENITQELTRLYGSYGTATNIMVLCSF